MADTLPIYCTDTSSLIDFKERNPPDLYPGPWEKLAELGLAGRLVAPREVRRELEAGDDELVSWASRQANLFRDPGEAEVEAVKEILVAFPRFIDIDRERPIADPFVVALALVHNRSQAGVMFPQQCIVVTQERGRRAITAPPKIPDVCAHYGIEAVRLLALMRAEGWAFR